MSSCAGRFSICSVPAWSSSSAERSRSWCPTRGSPRNESPHASGPKETHLGGRRLPLFHTSIIASCTMATSWPRRPGRRGRSAPVGAPHLEAACRLAGSPVCCGSIGCGATRSGSSRGPCARGSAAAAHTAAGRSSSKTPDPLRHSMKSTDHLPYLEG